MLYIYIYIQLPYKHRFSPPPKLGPSHHLRPQQPQPLLPFFGRSMLRQERVVGREGRLGKQWFICPVKHPHIHLSIYLPTYLASYLSIYLSV